MTKINPEAFLNAVKNGVANYEGNAPAVLMEVERNGLSAELAQGVLSIEDDTPATTDAKFEIGSQSKMMTSTLVIQLASEGHFSLDDKLSDIIDVTPLVGIANIQDVTLRQLMAHTSGIPDYLNDYMAAPGVPILWERLIETPPQPVGLSESLQFLIDQNAPAEFAPGERAEYSNTGFLLLQLAIEQATGNALGEELQTRIFDPLGMTSSSLPGFEPPAGIISSYFNLGDGLLDVTHLPLASSGDSGVVSTTADMIKFMKALVVDETLIPESYQQDLEGVIPVHVIDDELFVGHYGGVTGTTSVTMVHLATGTIFSSALSIAGEGPQLEQMFTTVIGDVLTNGSWLGFEEGDGDLAITLTASELDVSEADHNDGSVKTLFDMQGVTLAMDGSLSTQDTDRLSFEDGSRLLIADEEGSRISVRRDAKDAAWSDNQLIGLGSKDRLIGGHGDDKILGNAGNDRLVGKRGDDFIAGGTGDDRLSGNRGNDVLDGGEGDDILIGGKGADTFVFLENAGDDTIFGFENGRDKIDLTALNLSFQDLHVESFRGSCASEVAFDGGSILLINSIAPLGVDDFLF